MSSHTQQRSKTKKKRPKTKLFLNNESCIAYIPRTNEIGKRLSSETGSHERSSTCADQISMVADEQVSHCCHCRSLIIKLMLDAPVITTCKVTATISVSRYVYAN